jgi:RNA polymerase sigma factor (sigma-70 family)
MTDGPETDAARPVDDDVAKRLVGNHRAFLAFLEKRVGNRAVAEDILQEAFSKSIQRLSTLRDGESVIPWFYRTLRNATVDYYRRRSAADRALATFAEELETSEQPSDAMHAEVCQCVSRLADTLKPEYASALRRVEIDGASMKELAAEAGISEGNAAVRVHRAREALRRQVLVSCGTCAEHGCVSCTCDSAKSQLSAR